MSFLLVRVDDRLLHGQVACGWGAALGPARYVIVDDRIAADAWEREAFVAAGGDVEVDVLAAETFAASWRTLPAASRSIVLLASLATLVRLRELDFAPDAGIDLGGLHARPGSREILPFLHLTREDEVALSHLIDSGYDCYAQELPGSRRYGAAWLRAHVALDQG